MRLMGAFLLLWIGLSSAARAGDIPVIGLDENGNETMHYYSADQYAEGTAQMIGATYEDTMPVLRRAQKEGKLWRLRELSLGIGVELSLGFTPFFKLGLAPRFRANFSNSTSPVIP